MPPTLANGKICYIEIPAADVTLSAGFYRKVFNCHICHADENNLRDSCLRPVDLPAFDDPQFDDSLVFSESSNTWKLTIPWVVVVSQFAYCSAGL